MNDISEHASVGVNVEASDADASNANTSANSNADPNAKWSRRPWLSLSRVAQRLRRSAGLVLGVFGVFYLRFCCRTSRLRFLPEADAVLRQTLEAGTRCVLVCWHDEFLLSLIAIQQPRLRGLLFVTNDSLGGSFLERCCRGFGVACQIIQRSTPRAARLSALIDGLRRQGGLAIAADYGKPWYKARPTAMQLAAATDGCVLACRFEPKHKLQLRFGTRRAYLPLPFNDHALWIGPPLRASASIDTDRAKLERELNHLQTLSAWGEQRRIAAAATRSNASTSSL